MDNERLLRLYHRMAADSKPYIEERTALNDFNRSRIENGENPTLIRLDTRRVGLETYIRDLGNRLEVVCLRRKEYDLKAEVGVRNSDDYRYGDFEYRVEEEKLRCDIERAQKWLNNTNDRIDKLSQHLKQEEEEAHEASKYECRKAHYAIVHDLCIRRERNLRWVFWGSAKACDEKRAKKLLSDIERWHGNKGFKRNGVRYCGEDMPVAWYWKLAMLVIKFARGQKFFTSKQLDAFSSLSKEEKKKARKEPKNFWVSTADRLMNLRKAIKDFKLPTNDYTLEILETPYNEARGDEEDGESGPVYKPHNIYLSEDALIETIDRKRNKERTCQ